MAMSRGLNWNFIIRITDLVTFQHYLEHPQVPAGVKKLSEKLACDV
jgi:hypothetical protein